MLDKAYKQRMVGALVLIAIAVIFLPMLFTREDEARTVRVDAPPAPEAPLVPQVQIEPVAVPEPQPVTQIESAAAASSAPPAQPIAPAPAPAPPAPKVVVKPVQAPVQPATPAPAPAPAPAQAKAPSGVDANGLSVSWSVQVVSLSNRANADSLQKTLRAQGYNAYVRSSDGINRVFVGPLIERAEAERLRDQIAKQQKFNGIVVRFQPERG